MQSSPPMSPKQHGCGARTRRRAVAAAPDLLTRFWCERLLLFAVALFFSPTIVLPAATGYGPAKGALVIVGGGSTEGTGIIEKFVELAGGRDAKYIIVPTAMGNRQKDGSVVVYQEERTIRPWRKLGLKNVRMLHTHDPKIADTEAFVKDLTEAGAVWFDGGRQWNLVDSYANTRTFREFHKVLERGGVIAGSSAGATIQGHYLVRGDTSGSEVMMTREPNHQLGFGFLRRSAIDQHINTRNRWDDLIPVIKEHPDLLGIGLSEGTAIIVQGDSFAVMGRSKIAVHDSTRRYEPWEKPYFVLGAGDSYDMKLRKVTTTVDALKARRGDGAAQ